MIRRACSVSLTLLLVVLASAGAWADPQWTKLPTVPYTLNNKQDAIVFADAQRGWYGNGTGRVYRTDDAGAHWKQIWEKRGTYVRALDFADADLGFLGNIGADYYPNVTDSQPLYITRDGGDHWRPVVLQGDKQIKGVLRSTYSRSTERSLQSGPVAGLADPQECWNPLTKARPGVRATCATSPA